MWFSFALFGYSCLAIVAILDKYILSEEKVKPIIFVFYSSIFLLPLALAFPFLRSITNPIELIVILAGALAFVLSLGTMYLAYSKSEVSHSGPFIGALIPLFILVLSQIFLNEIITNGQVVGIVLLSLGTLIISMQKNPNKNREWKRGMLWAIVSALLFSVFHVSAKYLYQNIGFGSGFTYLWGTVGLIGIILFVFPEVRHEIFPEKNLIKKIIYRIFPPPSRPKKQFITIASDKVLSIIGVVSIQYAVSIGSVTKVNALSGAQYALLVIIVAALSRFFPRVFQENYEKGEMAKEAFAILFIVIGLAFLVR